MEIRNKGYMNTLTLIPNKDLRVLNSKANISEGKNTYRAITKCKAGFMVSSTVEASSPIMAFRQYNPKSLQSLAIVGDGLILLYMLDKVRRCGLLMISFWR